MIGAQIDKRLFPDGRDMESVCRVYGDPRPLLHQTRDLTAEQDILWRKQILHPYAVPFPAPVQLSGAAPGTPATRVFVHRLLFQDLMAVMADLHASGAWRHVTSFAGCYSFRLRRGTAVPSMHSWAAALDFNAERYPLGTEADEDDPFVKRVVPIFKDHGWTWGGDFSRPDPMHFSAVTRE